MTEAMNFVKDTIILASIRRFWSGSCMENRRAQEQTIKGRQAFRCEAEIHSEGEYSKCEKIICNARKTLTWKKEIK